MAQTPHPYSFTAAHLARVKAHAAALGPDATDADVTAACEAIAKEPHVNTATYNPARRQIDIALKGDLIAFPVKITA